MVRFDKPCLRVKGALEYFREHMRIGDYLSQDGHAELTWYGRGAERLGLSGQCRPEEFENLCHRRHPRTGALLTVRDRGASGRVCYFGQISPPKDVSLACLVGGDERIRAWWDESVRETLQELEALTATRVRTKGKDEDRPTGNLVSAIVTHETSRALDPQLHTHIAVMNVTYDETERRWKSVQPSGFYRHQGYLREVCYNRLAAKLLAAGYELEPARRLGFALKGVPANLRERFSQRRAQILRAASATGALSQDALQAIAGNSREAKTNASAADLRDRWHQRAGPELTTLRAVVASAKTNSPCSPSSSPSDSLDFASAHLFERQSVVDERELLRDALLAGRGHTSPLELRALLEEKFTTGELLRVGSDIASRDTLAAEQEFVAWADAHRASHPPLGEASPSPGLDSDQAEAVTALLRSPSRVVILQGDAGTGKTTCLRTIVAGIESHGGKVFGCAPSAGAADVLRKELTPTADTLQQVLVNAQLQESLRGRVLIVDEAGLVSVRQMRDLCRLAAANDNRLLLVGDVKQHTSVEAGDALRCLQRFARVPVARLTQIRRQKDPAYREAVRLLARGQVAEAFRGLAKLGAIRESPDSRALFRAAGRDYLQTLQSGKTCLAIAPVWSDIHDFNAEVRTQMKQAGLLYSPERIVPTLESLQWTRAQCRRVSSFQPGDVLTFHRNVVGFSRDEHATVVRREGSHLILRTAANSEVPFDPRRTGGFDVGLARDLPLAAGDRLLLRTNVKSAGLNNGDIVEVAGFTPEGRVRLTGNQTLPADFRHFTYGYSTTSHSAQGKTVDRGLLLLTEAGFTAANVKQSYVSNSRFRETQAIYTTDARAARRAMQRPADRRLASELKTSTTHSSFHTVLLHRLSRVRLVAPALTLLRGWRDTLLRIPHAAPTRT